jgi:hypothetical protein
MRRREVLVSSCIGASALLAGCTSDSGNGNGNGDGGNQEQFAEVVDHEFIDPDSNTAIYAPITVENTSDEDLETVRVQCQVYADNERLDDAYANIDELGGGIETTERAELYDLRERINDVTHYTLTLTYFVGDGNQQYEHESEFEDFQVQDE